MVRDLLILEAFLNIGIHRMGLRGEGLKEKYLELPNFNCPRRDFAQRRNPEEAP